MKKLIVVAGPNGSGKSTFINSFLKRYLDECTFVNPDALANTLYKNIKDEKEKYTKAFQLADFIRDEAFDLGKNILIETVNSTDYKDEFYKKCRDSGYVIYFYYVGTDSPDINVSRICGRVSEGGHDVPKEKIRDRYYKSLERIELSWNMADVFYLFDNSQSEYKLCVHAIKDDNYLVRMTPKWVRKYFIDRIDI